MKICFSNAIGKMHDLLVAECYPLFPSYILYCHGSNLHFADSFVTVFMEPADGLPTLDVLNLILISCCLGRSKESITFRFSVKHFVTSFLETVRSC